jgi:hypothetical protein
MRPPLVLEHEAARDWGEGSQGRSRRQSGDRREPLGSLWPFPAPCAGYLGHRFEKIGILCMIDQVSLPKHVRCEYNEREPYCSYASSNAPISPRRGSIRALCIHLNEATSMFHHVDHHALESAMSRALGLWYSCPGQFRQLMINGMQQDHSWASAGQRSLKIYEYFRHK